MTATNIFVNIPTTDLERAKSFYEALGYTINPLFTDKNAACVVLDDSVYFMVVTREFLATFTDKQIIDPKTHAGAAAHPHQHPQRPAQGVAGGGGRPTELRDLLTRLMDPRGVRLLAGECATIERFVRTFHR